MKINDERGLIEPYQLGCSKEDSYYLQGHLGSAFALLRLYWI